MKKERLNEDFKQLDEFIQKINDIMTPFSFRDELRAVMDKNTRKNLYEKNPRCFMPVRIGNKDIPFLPICNRNGATDKEMIAFSMKLANRLNGREDVNRGMLEITMKKLQNLHNRYSKEIPKPIETSVQKSNITKSFNRMKEYMDKIKEEQK
jgi:hypothetical protein